MDDCNNLGAAPARKQAQSGQMYARTCQKRATELYSTAIISNKSLIAVRVHAYVTNVNKQIKSYHFNASLSTVGVTWKIPDAASL